MADAYDLDTLAALEAAARPISGIFPCYVVRQQKRASGEFYMAARNALPAMIADLRTLRADNAAALEMLREREWVIRHWDDKRGEYVWHCQSCGWLKSAGHAPPCKLNALLLRKGG